ncbi:MAG: hypothetical protein HWE20_12270 [Gammaproteobacteria bacterium]|nr:hypothetical protein [Gammaproteobacteria bacterium]
MKRKKLLCCLLVALIASCGGGGGGSEKEKSDANNGESNDPETERSLEGNVGFSNFSGASVCLDINNNWICDAGDRQTTSDDEGKYNFTGLTDSEVNHRLIATTTDTHTPMYSSAGTGSARNINLVTTLAEFSHHQGTSLAQSLIAAQANFDSADISTLGNINQTESANLASNPATRNYWRLLEGAYLYMMRGVEPAEYALLNTVEKFPSMVSESALESLTTIANATKNTTYHWEALHVGIHDWKADNVFTAPKFFKEGAKDLAPEGIQDIEYISFGNDIHLIDDKEQTSLRINVKWNIADTDNLSDTDKLAESFSNYSLRVTSNGETIWSLADFDLAWNEASSTGVYAAVDDGQFDLFVRDSSKALSANQPYRLELCRGDCSTGTTAILATQSIDNVADVTPYASVTKLSALTSEIKLYTIDGATTDDGNITPVFAFLPLNYRQGTVRGRLSLTDSSGNTIRDEQTFKQAISTFYVDSEALDNFASATLRLEVRDDWDWQHTAWRIRTGESSVNINTKPQGLTEFSVSQIALHNIWADGEVGGWRDGYRIRTRHWFDDVKPIKMELLSEDSQIVGTICLPSELPNRSGFDSFSELETNSDGTQYPTDTDCGENTYTSVFNASKTNGWFDIVVNKKGEWRVDDAPVIEVNVNGEIDSGATMMENTNYAAASTIKISYSDGTAESVKLPKTRYNYSLDGITPEKIQICKAANDRLRFTAQGPDALLSHKGTVSPTLKVRIRYQDGVAEKFERDGAFGNSATFLRFTDHASDDEDKATLKEALAESDIDRVEVTVGFEDYNIRNFDTAPTLEIQIRDDSFTASDLLNAPMCQ